MQDLDDIRERADRIIAVSPALAREIARRLNAQPRGLTKRQAEALTFLKDFQSENGIAPTYAEAASALGISRTAAFNRIQQLKRRGHIEMLSHQCRSITLVDAA